MLIVVRLIAAILACVMLLLPVEARADECTGLAITPTKLTVDGVEGVFLPKDQAACLAKRAEELGKAQALIADQDHEVATLKREVRIVTLTATTTQALADQQKLRGDEYQALSLKQGKRLEEDEAWYNSKLLWTGIGAASVATLVLILRGASTSPTVNVQK